MKTSWLIRTMVVPVTVFGLAIAIPAVAQETSSNPPASESMHQAGQSMEQAGSDTMAAARHAGEGTATAMRDTKITAKVKTALHEAGITKRADIHVTTIAGVVQLNGSVPSTGTASRAVQLAKQTEGVKAVTNDLVVLNTSKTD
ncbi:MAG TPA: BON domain-containing protein [Candidatus Binataceae bacterium]|nr:BON domain-containing protein [Candidatus Binataceae bacterium]